MCKKLIGTCLACIFLQIGIPYVTFGQESFSDERKKEIVVSNLFWQKLKVQRIIDTVCKDEKRTMVCIYSDMNNLALPDGITIAKPILSTPFVENISKHIYCLTTPSPEFCDTSKNTMAVFVVTNDSIKLQKMLPLIEQKITPDLILKNIALASIPLHWQGMKPERCSKKEAHRSRMTTVFIYSDLEKIYLPDGEELIRPTVSIPVAQGITKHVFNLLYPIPNFVIDNYANRKERYVDVATFAVSNHELNLPKILDSVDSRLNPKPVRISISWKEIKPQKYNQKVCDYPLTPVIVYSDVENLVFTDDKKIATLVESSQFKEGIRKQVFCLSASSHNSFDFNVENDSLINVTTFVVSRDVDKLYSISNLAQGVIISVPEEKRGELISDVTTPKEKSFENEDGEAENTNGKIYRIQVSAMRNSTLQAEAIQKMYRLPYTVKKFFKNEKYCFMIGEYKSLEEAKKEVREIRAKYKIKDAFIVMELQNQSFVNIMDPSL